jgi:hypothetical protein
VWARVLAAVLAVGLGGCSTTPAPPRRDNSSVPVGQLRASVNQFRHEEGTRQLKAGVTNDGRTAIRVSRATIAWAGFAFPTVRLPGDPVLPGQTAAFAIDYGKARCGRPPAGGPALVAVVDGRTRRLPLHVDDPGLLERLRLKACAATRLARVASVHLELARRTVRSGGAEQLPATIVVRRRAGSAATVRIVDLDGSVLIDLEPRDGSRALPAVLRARDSVLSFPVRFSSTQRCNAHAQSQSQQTFLFSAYLRLGPAPPQRVLLGLSNAERDRLIGLVERGCGD